MNMPLKKVPCPSCGNPKSRLAELCRACKPSYERTDENRAKMSEALKGRRHNWRSGGSMPGAAQKIAAAWTPEMREAARLRTLARNPDARYHGLSAKEAKRKTRSVGHCSRCGVEKERLDIHHKDRNKHNQTLENLEVLCHQCHMQEHRHEIGWAAYHQKRS